MLTWHVMPDGTHVWKDGVYVGVIPLSQAERHMEKLSIALQAERLAREMQSK